MEVCAQGSVGDREWEWALSVGRVVELDRGQQFAWQGMECSGFGVVLTGELRVFRMSRYGRQVNLYRVGPSECCGLMASSLLTGSSCLCYVKAEVVSSLLLLPASIFQQHVFQSRAWLDYLFACMHERMAGMVGLLEDVAFGRVEARLARLLVNLAQAGQMTQQQLAAELGSSREVVCRLLKKFSDKGYVKADKGRLTVLDSQSLRHLYQG